MHRVLVQEYTTAWAGLDDDANTALQTKTRERENMREREANKAAS